MRRDESVVLFPATIGRAVEGIISVGGIDRENHFWDGSCRGELVEMAGPAKDVFVASLSSIDAYRFKPDWAVSGTSWSTPYVSGMAALLLESNPYLTPAQLEAQLAASPSRVEGIPVPVMPEPSIPQKKRRAIRH
jgi:subtilisin family serine protease